jgi:gliding motility-associated-like protein
LQIFCKAKNFKQMKKNIVALLALLFTMTQFVKAQDPVVINFSDATASGSTVTINVTADNFTDISGMQLFIGWDESVLNFQQITNINGELDGFNSGSFANPPSIPEGHVNVSWFSTNPFGESETLPDGTVLFSILLSVEGDPCDETSFDLVDYNGQPNEAYDGNFNEVDLQFNPGTVLIPGEDCGGSGGDEFGLGLIGGEISGLPGSNVCVEITVDSFVNINSAQFAVQYDESILEYTGATDGPLTDELVNPTGTNHIRFLWLVPPDENPNTLPDGTVLIEFCFNVIGNLGECSPIDIVSITTPPALDIEFINGDGQVVDYYTTSGEVCAGDPPPMDDVVFIASDETGEQNSNVCVDISTEGFEEVGSFQWAFAWDDDVMTYDGLGTTNNINISDTDVNLVASDKLRVSWLPTTAVTQPDGTVLFQLCFDLVGDCDASTTAVFTNDGSTFQIEVGDGDGNTMGYSVQNGSVSIECACELTYTKTDADCHGEETGAIYTSLNGCDAQSYEWNTGATTPDLIGIGAGLYKVTVTDLDNNEIVSDWITITEPSQILVTETITNVSCGVEGKIELNVQGGTPGYTFNWNPNVSSNNVAEGLDAGAYSVTVTDQNGCEINKTYGVTGTIPELSISGSMTDITCKDANDGSISISASDGCPGYNINWSDGQATGLFNRTNLAAGSYTATVTDQEGQNETINFTITNPTFALEVNGTTTDAIIDGADGSIDVTVTGGEPDYTFQWNNGATSEDVTVAAGSYTVFVEDARGCTAEASFDVIERYDKIVMDAEVADLYNGYGVSCFGECDGKINLSVTGNVPWTLYVDGQETELDEFPQLNFCPGEYEIKVVDDEYGYEASETLVISEPDQLLISYDPEEDVSCSTEGDGTIAISVEGGVEDYSFNWGSGIDAEEYVEGLEPGIYSVVVTDANKCQALLSDIEVEECQTGDCYLATPVITPNGDGFNDYFDFSCLRDFPSTQLDVYDRWGRKVFSMQDYDGSWDGMGTDGELVEGSYMWVLIATLDNGDERVYKGTLSILR